MMTKSLNILDEAERLIQITVSTADSIRRLYRNITCLTETALLDTSGVTAIIGSHSTLSCQPQASQDEEGTELFKETEIINLTFDERLLITMPRSETGWHGVQKCLARRGKTTF